MTVQFWLRGAVCSLWLHSLSGLIGAMNDGPWWWRITGVISAIVFGVAAVRVGQYQRSLDPDKPMRMVVNVPKGQSVTIKAGNA